MELVGGQGPGCSLRPTMVAQRKVIADSKTGSGCTSFFFVCVRAGLDCGTKPPSCQPRFSQLLPGCLSPKECTGLGPGLTQNKHSTDVIKCGQIALVSTHVAVMWPALYRPRIDGVDSGMQDGGGRKLSRREATAIVSGRVTYSTSSTLNY